VPSQLPGSTLKTIVDSALKEGSYSQLSEEAMSLFRLSCLIVDIQLRHKRDKENEAVDKLPGRHLLVDLPLEVDQREDFGNEHKN
jgi:hypothetical protein